VSAKREGWMDGCVCVHVFARNGVVRTVVGVWVSGWVCGCAGVSVGVWVCGWVCGWVGALVGCV
jgi:hypothetical protein